MDTEKNSYMSSRAHRAKGFLKNGGSMNSHNTKKRVSSAKKKRKKRIETSKKILIVSYASSIALTLIVIIGSFTGYDTSDITSIASLAWAEVAVSNAFYYKKAAKENVPKVISSMPKEFREQLDINQLLNN